jgi:putative DNA primase/helicase
MSDIQDRIEGAEAAVDYEAQAEALETEAKRLAGLSKAQRAIERKAVAKKYDVSVAVIDVLVKQHTLETETGGQGRTLELPEPELWPTPVDGGALLSKIADMIQRYVVLPDEEADAVALWVMHTHAIEVTYISPRLLLTSPEMRCGKTVLLSVVSLLVPRPVMVANISPAPLFRTIEIARPTLLLDEADSFAKNSEDLRNIINSGHQRDGAVIRSVGEDHEPRLFSTFAAMGIAGIGAMPGTVEDRSIIIRLRRKKRHERVERLRLDRTPELDLLAIKVARWVADNINSLKEADPDIPDRLGDRATDNWRCLIAIADEAGGEWPVRARRAALSLSAGDDTDSQSLGVKLLADVAAVFEATGADRLASADLANELHKMEDRPWPEFGRAKKPISVNQIARLLSPYGVAPNKYRDGANTFRGYSLDTLTDAFSRYLPPQTGTTEQSAEIHGLQVNSKPERSSSCSSSDIGSNVRKTAECSGVAVENLDRALNEDMERFEI